MHPIRIFFISVLSLMTSSCAWIGRDYYFDASTHAVDWHSEFQAGRGSDKNGVHPDTVFLTYNTETFSLKFNIAYQDVTVFGPIIVPIIPLPWQHTDKLYLEARVEARNKLRFDVNDWRLTDLDTNREYKPDWINMSMPANLEVKDVKKLVIQFPVKAAQIKNLKLDFGAFEGADVKIIPPTLTLRKIKGEWHYNQFSL